MQEMPTKITNTAIRAHMGNKESSTLLLGTVASEMTNNGWLGGLQPGHAQHENPKIYTHHLEKLIVGQSLLDNLSDKESQRLCNKPPFHVESDADKQR
jgi:hypothetical protein